MKVNKQIESTHEEWVIRCNVGQAMQRYFDANGVDKSVSHIDLIPFYEGVVGCKDALPWIDYYKKNIYELKGYRS